jgi:hypothetical protein
MYLQQSNISLVYFDLRHGSTFQPCTTLNVSGTAKFFFIVVLDAMMCIKGI